MTEIVTHFKMGQDIPDWMLVAEPEQPGAPRGNFRFNADVDVIDTPDYFLVVPVSNPGRGIIDNDGMLGHRIFPPNKLVRLVNAQSLWTTLDQPNWSWVTEPAIAFLPPDKVQPVPDTHRGFWQRLLYVLRGR